MSYHHLHEQLPFTPDENPICFLGRVHISPPPHEMIEELEWIVRARGETFMPAS